MKERTYIAIDLKSFYASVECRERKRDPMTTNLVVADSSRTDKTICLAVSPSLKSWGISGRARLFEVVSRVREVNAQRLAGAGIRDFRGSSDDACELAAHPDLKLDYIIAPPRMALYVDYSTRIYRIYLRYIAPEDIHVYSIDEVFIDATGYLKTYGLSARDLARRMIRDILDETGITATVGIGTNLYLAKIAMDIDAKHMPADADGVRISELDEMSYRRRLWTHEPITDFWRVGRGTAKKLARVGLYTMGDIARCSLGGPGDYYNEDLLFEMLGVNAELLIDHAWGYEPCTMADVRSYQPRTSSLSSGQVLQEPYPAEKARIIVREMTELMALDLVDKGLTTDQMVLTVNYDIENLTDPARRKKYRGPVKRDFYGRQAPKPAHGTANLPERTSAGSIICREVMALYDRIIDPDLLVRRITIEACRLKEADPDHMPDGAGSGMTERKSPSPAEEGEQMDLFTDYESREEDQRKHQEDLQKEHQMQEAMLAIKRKYGKNAILTGTNLEEGATTRERNRQIGGHKA